MKVLLGAVLSGAFRSNGATTGFARPCVDCRPVCMGKWRRITGLYSDSISWLAECDRQLAEVGAQDRMDRSGRGSLYGLRAAHVRDRSSRDRADGDAQDRAVATSFLNPQMTQISADRDQDKQTARELRRACPERHSTFVEALVSRACEKQAVGRPAFATGLAPRLHRKSPSFTPHPLSSCRLIGVRLH